jgi:heme oxygenase
MSSSAAQAVKPLSVAMKEGSTVEHEAAEHSPYVSELLSGRINRQGYADYLLRLRLVYEALEAAVRDLHDDPLVAAVYDPALERLAALESDIDYWAPGAARDIDSPAALAYRDRLVGASWGGALVAHHYTRYLGDLSGGQYLGPAIARAYGLATDGHRFFVFAGVDPFAFKARYRQMLDTLNWPRSQERVFLTEVGEAYRLNTALLTELKERWS